MRQTNENYLATVFCKLQSLGIPSMKHIKRTIKHFSSFIISYLTFRYFPAINDGKCADYIIFNSKFSLRVNILTTNISMIIYRERVKWTINFSSINLTILCRVYSACPNNACVGRKKNVRAGWCFIANIKQEDRFIHSSTIFAVKRGKLIFNHPGFQNSVNASFLILHFLQFSKTLVWYWKHCWIRWLCLRYILA